MSGPCFFRVALSATWLIACSAASRSPLPYPQQSTSDEAIAAGVTATAAVIYAVGGGCKISDCPAATVCNPATERCERIECGGPVAKVDLCPSGSQCDPRSGSCVPF